MAEGKTMKIVDFHKFCPICVRSNTPEVEEPCNSCMTHNYNENSKKPVNYIEDKKKGKKNGRS